MPGEGRVLVAIASLWVVASCAAQTGGAPIVASGSAAAEPAEVVALPPESLNPDEDIVNIQARAELAIGMTMEIRVAPRVVELVHIGMMQVRRSPRGEDVRVGTGAGGERPDGDWVIVEAFGRGELVSRTAVSDPLVEVVEEGADVRIEDRTVFASLPTPRRVDTLRIISTAAGQTEDIDIAMVMDQFCMAAPAERACQP
jgi:hypothetical protein